MVVERAKTSRLSIYLIKSRFRSHGDILKGIENLESRDIEGIGKFYFGKSHTFRPDWIKRFFGG